MFMLLVYLLASSLNFANGAPSTTTKPDFYDQRQVGTYNIRLNLKDLNIIAIVPDDADNEQDYYDYELPPDYTDVPMPSTTNSSLTNISTTTVPTISIKPKPITTTTLAPSTPLIELTSKKATKTSTTLKTTTSSAKTTTVASTTPKVIQKTTVHSVEESIADDKLNKSSNLGDRIPVFVMQQYGSSKTTQASSSVTIVTEKTSVDDVRPSTVGRIHFQRCPQGFSRDKSGECRKLRRPPLYALSRLTSNLASTFRRPADGILAVPTVSNRQ